MQTWLMVFVMVGDSTVISMRRDLIARTFVAKMIYIGFLTVLLHRLQRAGEGLRDRTLFGDIERKLWRQTFRRSNLLEHR
jgi:hypothetical protein